jgi:multidrug efflux pump subunit AcrB
MVNVELPGGAALNRTEVVAAQAAKVLKSIPAVKDVVSIGGSSMLGGFIPLGCQPHGSHAESFGEFDFG